jgi:hypothetical protein
MHEKLWTENLKRRDHSEDLGVDGRVILERIFRETGWEFVDRPLLAQDRNQCQALVNTGSITGREFLDWMSDYYLVKNDSVPWSQLR